MIPRFYIASKVAEFKKENGRMPTSEEYKQIAWLAYTLRRVTVKF